MVTRSVPKVMRMIFLRSAEGPRKESGGWGKWRGNPGSLTFLSWVRAFVAVGTLAKCVVVFVSCHGWKCRGVWSSVTQSSSARNLENPVPKRCSCWGRLMGMLFCLQPKSSDGTWRSRTEGRALRTNSVQGVLQLLELRTMWLEWRLFWIGTDVCAVNRRGGKTYLKWMSTESLRKICTWEKFVRNWSQRICLMNKRQSCVGFSGTLGSCDKWAHFLQRVITIDETWVFE